MTNSLVSALDDIPMCFIEVEALMRGLEGVATLLAFWYSRIASNSVGVWEVGHASSQQRQGDDV